MEDDGLSNKPLDESFYLIPPPSVYDYLDYTDFFISIWFERVEKRVIAVIAAISVTTGTPLVAMVETAIMLGTRLN